MFGGLCFMVNDKMCLGVEQERLMVRLDPLKVDEVMEKEGCKPMDFTGKVMKGYVFVDIEKNVLRFPDFYHSIFSPDDVLLCQQLCFNQFAQK